MANKQSQTQTQETGSQETMTTEQTTKTESQENQETKTETTEQTTTETKTEEIKTETDEETETEETDEDLDQYLRRLYFQEDVLMDSWILLKEVKIGKENYQNIFIFSWHPSVLYSCNTVPMGLGQPRFYDQFIEFLSSSNMILLGQIGLSIETNEPTLKTFVDNQLNSTAESVVSEILDPKILKKLVINESCIDPELWVGLNTLYKRLNGSAVDLKEVTARGVITPTLKAIGSYKKALKGAMDF